MKINLKNAAVQADGDKNGDVSRVEWRVAQRKDWFHIWLWPALGAAATCLIFIVGFHGGKPTGDVANQEDDLDAL